MKNNKPDLMNWKYSSLAAIVLILALISGCSSGTSKTTKSTRAESPPPQAMEANNPPVATSPPVVSEPLEPAPQKPPTRPPSTTIKKTPRSVSKAPAPTTSPSPKKRAYKRRETKTVNNENSLDALLGTTPTMTAQESSSGSSIRGLSPVSESYGKDHKIPDDILDSVRRMEAFEISDDEIERFQKAGKLK